jgi:hypothetical protein
VTSIYPSKVSMPFFLRVGCFLCLCAVAAARAESIFPLGKSLSPQAAAMLPYGLGLEWYWQEQDYRLEQLTFAVPGGFPPAGQLTAENKSRSAQVRPNLWLLPFLQVHGLFGRVQSDTLVRNVPLLGQVTTGSRGTVYGGGATLIGGHDNWFASASVNTAFANLQGADNSIRTFTVEPHVGRNFAHGAVWVGAMYQDTEEKASGTFALSGLGTVPYAVRLKSEDAWNYHVGGQWRVRRHVGLMGQVGFGQRRSVYLALDFAW